MQRLSLCIFAAMNTQPEHVKCLIIGSGPAGYTAAIYAARADMKPVLYQGMQPGGQLTETTEVDNFPGYPDGINGPQMMADLEAQAKRFDTDVRNGWVTEVELRLRDAGGGVSACAVCDGFFYRGQEVVIVGAGDTACEEASYLAKLCSKVTMLVRRGEMRASKAMQNRVFGMENIEVLWNTQTVEVLGKDAVEAIRVVNNETQVEHDIPATGFFVAIGHKPNTDVFKGWIDLDDQGYIKYEEAGTSKTNIAGVYVCGDAADKVYRQAVTAAGTGCMAALDSERYLAARGIH